MVDTNPKSNHDHKHEAISIGDAQSKTDPTQSDRQYWDVRAQKYQKLEWASRQDYLNKIAGASNLQSTDVVLDAGTGTGLIAKTISPYVLKVIGVDISEQMVIKGVDIENYSNIEYEMGDIRSLRFSDSYFDKVFARMVFHGLLHSVPEAALEIYRVIKPKGQFILSEGIPPDRIAEDWYTDMFKLKETRLTLFPDTLESILDTAGFKHIRTSIHISHRVSIRNWLENSGLPESQQAKIMNVHHNMPEEICQVYNAVFTEDGDVLLDMQFAITTGVK